MLHGYYGYNTPDADGLLRLLALDIHSDILR